MKNELTVNKRLAQLIIEKKSGMKYNSSPITNNVVKSSSGSVVSNKDVYSSKKNDTDDKIYNAGSIDVNKEVLLNQSEDPLIHNLVVDSIAKKILKLYVSD